MSLSDVAGLAGAFLMLAAYGAAALGWISAIKAPAHLLNLSGALLVLFSLTQDFNLAAAVLETAWAIIAFAGLVSLALKRRPSPN